MEVLVRGSVVISMVTAGQAGENVYIRKSDGKLTPYAGSEGTTVLLENVRIRRPGNAVSNAAEVVVSKRNIL